MLDLAFPMGWGAGTRVPAQPSPPTSAGVPADALPVDEVLAIFDTLVAELAGQDAEALEAFAPAGTPGPVAEKAETRAFTPPASGAPAVAISHRDGVETAPLTSITPQAGLRCLHRDTDPVAERTLLGNEADADSDDWTEPVVVAPNQVKLLDVDPPRERIDLPAMDVTDSIFRENIASDGELLNTAPEVLDKASVGLDAAASMPIAAPALSVAAAAAPLSKPVVEAEARVPAHDAISVQVQSPSSPAATAAATAVQAPVSAPVPTPAPAVARPVARNADMVDSTVPPVPSRMAHIETPATPPPMDSVAAELAAFQPAPTRPNSRIAAKDGADKPVPAVVKTAVFDPSASIAAAPPVLPRPVPAATEISREHSPLQPSPHFTVTIPTALHGATLQYAKHQQFEIAGVSSATVADQATLPAPTGEQIVQSLRLALTRDGGEARITLNPREFGDLTVTVKVEQGAVVARMQADTPAVREWLQQNQDTLRARLSDQDLRLDRLDVAATEESAESRQDADARRRDAHADERPRRRRQSSSATFEVVA